MTPGSTEHMLHLYRKMQFIRRFEEATAKAYAEGKILGFCHLYIGQEAVAVAGVDCLRDDDVIYTSYRDHGHALAKGMDPDALMAELFGRVTGCTKGLGGSMHLFDKEKGMWGGYGIVGAHVPLACGTAWAFRYRGEDRVVMCFMGDGATNQGVFFEAIQLASLWHLPIVFIVENNQYAMGTPLDKQMPIQDLSLKAVGFGMEHDRIEDDDVLALRERINEAVERARNLSAPTFLEVVTYRYRGHSMSDPAKYRTRDEVKEEKQRDPIKLLAKRLQEEYGLGERVLKDIDSEIKDRVVTAVERGLAADYPDTEVVLDNVYAGRRIDA